MQKILGTLFLISFLAQAKTLTLAWKHEARTIDSRFTTDAYSHYLSDLQHCALVTFNEDGTSVGNLAKDWRWKNNKTLEVFIKPNAKFSDGSAVTATDVKATYEFFKKTDLKKPSPLAGAFKKITKIDVKKNQLTFHLEEADTSFIPNLMIGILPAKLASKEMFEKPSDYVGCGPFV